MGVNLIVHGHHHVGYRAVAEDGLHAMGVAAAAGATRDGEVLWAGDTERHLTSLPLPWTRL